MSDSQAGRLRRVRSWLRRRWPLVAVGLVALGIAGYFLVVRAAGDIFNPGVDFRPDQADPTRSFVWPTYGLTSARTRYLPRGPRPPFREIWAYRGRELLEFSPVLARGTLFFVDNKAAVRAISAANGKVMWRRRVGSLAASAPAWSNGKLFVVALKPGSITSFDARTGRVRWRKDLGARSESSPLVVGDRVYFAAEDGTVYALRTRDGRQLWTYKANGVISAGLAYARGTLFFGDYAGEATAIRARDGRRVWKTATRGATLGRAGGFYTTPAVAFGRVYYGNTDGKFYSFSERTGQLAWSKTTGSYVYSAPAVAQVPGTPPTVYQGSHDGHLYALDASTGAVRFAHDGGGRIIGAPTIVGKVVYFANLDDQKTFGLDTRTGRRVFKFDAGSYNPVISDGAKLYITGYSSVHGLKPQPPRRPRPPRPGHAPPPPRR